MDRAERAVQFLPSLPGMEVLQVKRLSFLITAISLSPVGSSDLRLRIIKKTFSTPISVTD